ncbi:MAG: alpha/beta fold hydrolase [Bacteroidia bacterium]|nr:alpha/beta fold hydrolase [Bacteroidia bacterium]
MRLYFERLGEGPPAYFFLHGFLGSGDNWRSIARGLEIGGTFYLIDARNHGRSPHASTHRYPDMAQDLLELMESEALSQAHLLGHSMGGKTAMYVALHFPQQVSSLVVVDIAPRSYARGHDDLLEALSAVNLNVSRREEVEQQLAGRISDTAVRLFILKNLVRNEKGQFQWRINLSVLRQEYEYVLAEVEGPPYEGPVLFIKGEYSLYIRPSDEEHIYRLFPKAIVETIPKAGHWVHAENPMALLAVLRRFWKLCLE